MSKYEICKTCKMQGRAYCKGCMYNYPNLYSKDKIVEAELDVSKLFKFAPIMARDYENALWQRKLVHSVETPSHSAEIPFESDQLIESDIWTLDDNLCFGSSYTYNRLPTLREAPRNMWLVPWPTKPAGTNDIHNTCAVKFTNKLGIMNILQYDDLVTVYSYIQLGLINKDKLHAVMILD